MHMSFGQRRGMTTEQQSTEPVWGAPDPTPQRWGIRQTVLALGVAVVIAGLGGAAIYAATGSHSQQPLGHGMPFGPAPGGLPAHASGAPSALHGEYVVEDGGTFSTMLTQTGSVTAISPSSVTVRSEDGFTQTYALQSLAHTDQTVAVSDNVSIEGRRTGPVITAVNIQTGPGDPSGPPGPAPHN